MWFATHRYRGIPSAHPSLNYCSLHKTLWWLAEIIVTDILNTTDDHLLGGQVTAAAEIVQGSAALTPPHLCALLASAPYSKELHSRLSSKLDQSALSPVG